MSKHSVSKHRSEVTGCCDWVLCVDQVPLDDPSVRSQLLCSTALPVLAILDSYILCHVDLI